MRTFGTYDGQPNPEWWFFLEDQDGKVLVTYVKMTREDVTAANDALKDLQLDLRWHPMTPD